MGTHPIFESDFDCLTDVKMDTSTAGASGLKAEHQDDSVDDDSVFESGSNHADQCPPPAIVAVPTASTAGPATQTAPPPPLSLAQTIHAQHRQHILLPQTADPVQLIGSPRFPGLYAFPTKSAQLIPNLGTYGQGGALHILQPGHIPVIASPNQLAHTVPRLEEARLKNELTVYCNSANGSKITATLDKRRFGSGSRGTSIVYDSKRITPRQFECLCGLEKSRDWRRTIHYEGDTLKTLIQRGILRPHAQSCVCKICSSDECSSAQPKYEDEVRSLRGDSRRTLKHKSESRLHESSRPPKKSKSDVFFPLTVDSGPLLSLIHRHDDRRTVEEVLTRIDGARRLRNRQLSTVLTQIKEYETQLATLHESVASLMVDGPDNDYNALISSLTSVMERQKAASSSSSRPQIIQNLYRQHSVLSSSLPSAHHHRSSPILPSTTSTKFNLEPRSAPPESPVRERLIHDRRRTSSDTSQIAALRKAKICSARGCPNEAAFMCQGCNKSVYCGKKCQEDAWNQGHDEVCGETDDEHDK